MYSRALALDLGPKGIRVNVASLGPVITPGGDEARKVFSDATGDPADVFAQSVPLGRHGTLPTITPSRRRWPYGYALPGSRRHRRPSFASHGANRLAA